MAYLLIKNNLFYSKDNENFVEETDEKKVKNQQNKVANESSLGEKSATMFEDQRFFFSSIQNLIIL
jgi:hypothetical protein